MKLVKSILVLSLTMVLNTVYANETDGSNNDVQAYCNEQVELAGIEDSAERQNFINECIQSYSVSGDNTQSENQ